MDTSVKAEAITQFKSHIDILSRGIPLSRQVELFHHEFEKEEVNFI